MVGRVIGNEWGIVWVKSLERFCVGEIYQIEWQDESNELNVLVFKCEICKFVAGSDLPVGNKWAILG